MKRSTRQKQECLHCKKEYLARTSDIERGRGKFCSRECYYKHPRPKKSYIKTICRNCGKEFETWAAWLRKGGGKYCSRKCMAQAYENGENRKCSTCGETFYFQEARKRRGDAGRYCSLKCRDKGKSTIKYCAICGKNFKALKIYEGSNLEKKYCSPDCYHKSQQKKRLDLNCKHCGESFSVLESYLKHKPAIYCSLKCASQAQRKRIKVSCNTCGKIIEKKECYSYGKNYCSQDCRVESLKNGQLRICEHCGEEFYIRPSEINKGSSRNFSAGRFCSQTCYKKNTLPTGLELEGRKLLKQIDAIFEEQVPIGPYFVDALLGDSIIIEWDGEYWHSMPERIESDIRKDLFLIEKGYEVLRFTETEVYSFPTKVKSCIQLAIKRANNKINRTGNTSAF